MCFNPLPTEPLFQPLNRSLKIASDSSFPTIQYFQSKSYYLNHNEFNSLLNNKILDCSKLKVLVDNKIIVNEKVIFGLGRMENIMGKGENAGYQHFLLFLPCFQKASYTGSSKVRIVL